MALPRQSQIHTYKDSVEKTNGDEIKRDKTRTTHDAYDPPQAQTASSVLGPAE